MVVSLERRVDQADIIVCGVAVLDLHPIANMCIFASWRTKTKITLTRVVPILIPVSEMPPMLLKMSESVLISKQMCAFIN